MSGGKDTVLVISGEDATAKAVMAELRRHPVNAVLLDIGDFPTHLSLAAATTDSGEWSGRVTGEGIEVDLSQVRSVFYRRPTRFSLPECLSAGDAALAEYEARLGFGGVLSSMDCLWLCHPHAVARAEYKPLQLKELRRAGLAVPRTLITNDHAEAVAWAKTIGGPVVCKQMSPVALEEDGQVRIAYTTPVDVASLDPAVLACTAHCLQEQVTEKLFEARVTMVGSDAFGVAIHAGSEAASLDWRRDYASIRYERFDPPADVLAGMRSYLDTMGLNYGCFDLVATPDGILTYECNPAGQYLWLEHNVPLPVSAAVAALLAKGAL
ncbi:MAG: ATP-grasp ribosomal peptide maturase [Actinomycetota bacterium]|nr:ATP-grasp ribosomal peptide maturase [Actinomycetota bacterium]